MIIDIIRIAMWRVELKTGPSSIGVLPECNSPSSCILSWLRLSQVEDFSPILTPVFYLTLGFWDCIKPCQLRDWVRGQL